MNMLSRHQIAQNPDWLVVVISLTIPFAATMEKVQGTEGLPELSSIQLWSV